MRGITGDVFRLKEAPEVQLGGASQARSLEVVHV